MTSTKIRPRKLRKDFAAKGEVFGDNNDEVLVLTSKKTNEKVTKPKKVRAKKVRMSMSKTEEKRLEKGMQQDDNMSIGLMVLILVVCFVVGITLGYLLYRIALNGGM